MQLWFFLFQQTIDRPELFSSSGRSISDQKITLGSGGNFLRLQAGIQNFVNIADGLVPVKQQHFRAVYIDKLGVGMRNRILCDIPFEVAHRIGRL